MKRLSHLAYLALGVIASEGPCTAYTVMQSFKGSSSSYYSGSAGAIYPLVRRLKSSGMISARTAKAGKRSVKKYQLTKKGEKALSDWVKSLDESDVDFTVDLIRSRVLFFTKLNKRERQSLIKKARKNLEERIATHQVNIKEHRKDATPWQLLTYRNLLLHDKARLKWLDEVETAVG